MSAVKAAIDRVHEIIDALEAEGHKFAGELKSLFTGIAGDVPALEAEAKADVADVASTAETQGLAAAGHEAVADAEHLGSDALADVKAAVKDAGGAPSQPEPTA
jgi:hypothetical protein